MKYSVGKKTKGMCDRCGWKYELAMLRDEWTGLKVCPTCWEPKHEQLTPATNVYDSEFVRDPRPDNDVDDVGDSDVDYKTLIGRDFHFGDRNI